MHTNQGGLLFNVLAVRYGLECGREKEGMLKVLAWWKDLWVSKEVL